MSVTRSLAEFQANHSARNDGAGTAPALDATCPLCGAPDLGACDCYPDAVNAALAERSAA